MAVDDTGGGGEQGGNATQRRFEPLRLSRREPLQIIDAVRPGRVGNAFKTRDFAFFSGYDRLANLDMRDSMIAAIGVKALAPGDAAACFQAAGRIIKPAMNHLAVARRGLEPDRIGAFKDKYIVPRQRESPRRRKPDHPCTDHHAFDLVRVTPTQLVIGCGNSAHARMDGV